MRGVALETTYRHDISSFSLFLIEESRVGPNLSSNMTVVSSMPVFLPHSFRVVHALPLLCTFQLHQPTRCASKPRTLDHPEDTRTLIFPCGHILFPLRAGNIVSICER